MSSKKSLKKNSKVLDKSNTKTITKPNLYNDLHPEKSLGGTGFKNKESANKTIGLVKKRSLRYQFDVINTMYSRAKFHPNQTKNMLEAMSVFKKWLGKYKKLKKQEDTKYPLVPYDIVLGYEKLAEKYGTSEVARGIKKSTRTDEGFLSVLKKVKGKYYKLQYIPVKKNKPEGQDYWSYRINFIKSRLGQIASSGSQALYYTEGKHKGLPTKQHLILILHGYSPDKKIYQSKQ